VSVSVWCGPVGGPPGYARHEHRTHYAASTMKVAVLAALYASGLDLDTPVEVTHRFRSALPGGGAFVMPPEPGIAGTMTVRALAELMIVRSSNLATNLVLDRVGIAAADAVWRTVGARYARIRRGIEDVPARAAGITNEVTAADLALLLDAIAREKLPGSPAMRATMERTGHRDDIAAGLPAGTRLAHKSGWVTGIRHGAAIVYPRARPAYLLVVCTTTHLPDAAACRLVARIAAASWRRLGDEPLA
jgi:beta-lactamase class A